MTAPPRARPLSLLVDTNVLLDVVLAREPWASEAVLLLDVVARGGARGAAAGHAITTVHYVVQRAAGRTAANTAVSDLLEVVKVVALEASDFRRALALELRDYEDAVQVAAALKVGADLLVTRNGRDYRGAPVRACTPGEALAIVAGPA